MNQMRYTYKHEVPPAKVDLPCDQNAGHGDHWAILTDDINQDVPNWLQSMLETAHLSSGLAQSHASDNKILIANDTPCHIKQILSLEDGIPKAFVNAFPAVNSPYGIECHIERIIRCEKTSDAILRLKTKDGATIYAFDQLYAVNRTEYKTPKTYYVNFSAWAYHIEPSNQDETILVEDPVAIRYHRAFNDIVSQNGGQVPDDIDDKIRAWQPNLDDGETLAPVEINFGHSCIYLFGDTFGQEDEAWCQGQVLGISQTQFFNKDITLFDVVILREPDASPLVVRIAAVTTDDTQKIKVHDYIQANIWLQAAIYSQNQKIS
ncbi:MULTISPECIES: hypothetical protein [unclassified Moraxella]|uniref:hypothetical protein n=1 Tax=unclassified Moraxella TaxID=2685852 RepID=UPI00359DD3A7